MLSGLVYLFTLAWNCFPGCSKVKRIHHRSFFSTVEDSELPELKLDAIKMPDVEAALQKTKPTQSDSQLYLEWHAKYGSA